MIVVGYTGEKASLPAVEVAARLATREDQPLLIVTAFDGPALDLSLYAVFGAPDQAQIEEWCAPAFAEAEAAARAQGATDIRQKVILGPPSAALLKAAEPDDILIVGQRHRGEFTSAVLGSVAIQVSAHAPCPVVVIGKDAHNDWTGPVVVGVDGSETSRRAAQVAARFAARHDLPLTVVAAWQEELLVGVGEVWAYPAMHDDDSGIADATRAMVDQIAAELHRSHPELAVTTRVERGDPAGVLLDASRDATLLITGTRGRGGFTGLMLGSISHQLIHQARVPVMTVR